MKQILTYCIIFSCFTCIYGQELRNDFSYNKSDLIEAEVVNIQNIRSGNTREKIVIQGYDSEFPFYYYRNNENLDKHVVLLHGLGGSKNNWTHPASRGMELIDSLMAMEYNIIVTDAKYHGERTFERGFKGVSPPEFVKSIDESRVFVEMYSTTIRDIRIIFDYISQRNPNANIQIDLLGYSMGGAMALLLNAVDSRVNSVVACVAPVTRPYKEVLNYGWPSEIEEELKDITPNFYSSFQKAPVILLMGKKDIFTSEDEANNFIKGVEISDKAIKLYDSGHGLPHDYIYDATNWITTHNKR
jgi:alpha-beta hydrolase superfamily lysophospholipase